jgi:hypothetical protein
MLEACDFHGNPNLYVASVPSLKGAKVYAWPEMKVQVTGATGTAPAETTSLSTTQVPSPSDGSWSIFLSDTNDWFQGVKTV